METIRVFVLEDDQVTRENLIRKIEVSNGLMICGAAGSLAEAREQLTKLKPTIVLVDLELPDGDGSSLISEYTARCPNVPILVISVFGDEASVIRAISAGAQGYLLKDDPSEDLAEAIHQSIAGLSPISPAIATHLIRHFQSTDKRDLSVDRIGDPVLGQLSSRELDVLRLASKGLSYSEAAETLGVSINTIGTYTRRVYTKLAVNSRAEALFEARQLGLID